MLLFKKQFLIILFLFIALTVSGQIKSDGKDELPYIEVTGTAEKEVIPNEIFIDIIIREKYSGKNKITIQEQEDKFKAILKSLGIDLSNLSMSGANADYVRVRWQKKDVLTKGEYSLKVTDANLVGKVFQELEKLEITDAFISKVNHSQIESLRKEVKILAIKAAKNKADYLLEAIGQQAGKPLVIKETETYPNTAVNVRGDGMTLKGSRTSGSAYYVNGVKIAGSEESEIQFEKIKIQTSIYVKFGIK